MKELIAQLIVLLVMRQLLLYFFICHCVDCFVAKLMLLRYVTVITYAYATAHDAA